MGNCLSLGSCCLYMLRLQAVSEKAAGVTFLSSRLVVISEVALGSWFYLEEMIHKMVRSKVRRK